MPRAIIQFILYIPGITDSPLKKGMNAIFTDILIEKVTKRIGYEATLADIGYSIKIFENVGLKFKFKGYNDKLSYFIQVFFETLTSLASDGLA